METTEEKEAAPKRPPVTRPKSIAELEQLCREMIAVKIPVGRRIVEIDVRLLTPSENEKLELILSEAHPPTRTRADGQIEFDRSEPEYIKKLAHRQKLARAMALYWCVPLLAEGRPGLSERERVYEYVQGQLTDVAQEALYAVARSEQLVFEERLHFT
jgi:hypothetical protein